MHYTTGEILSVCGSHGSMHDFKIFKKSMRKLKFKPFFIVDKGYLGIKKLGFGCLMPSKAKKTEKLDSELKKLNREIGRRRIQVEHVFGRMKCFKILSCVSLYTTNFIGPLSYQAFSFLKLLALS